MVSCIFLAGEYSFFTRWIFSIRFYTDGGKFRIKCLPAALPHPRSSSQLGCMHIHFPGCRKSKRSQSMPIKRLLGSCQCPSSLIISRVSQIKRLKFKTTFVLWGVGACCYWSGGVRRQFVGNVSCGD